jgi:hypothetical protein
MSRGTQTFLIVAAILSVGLVYYYQETRLPSNNPYSQCQVLFWEDSTCAVRVARDRIMGGDGWDLSTEKDGVVDKPEWRGGK